MDITEAFNSYQDPVQGLGASEKRVHTWVSLGHFFILCTESLGDL